MSIRTFWLLWAFLLGMGGMSAGCDTDKGLLDSGEPDRSIDMGVDGDGDGVSSLEDCDDENPLVHPGAAEICDGLDNDCDEDVDEGVTTTAYLDSDGDGFGDDAAPEEFCEIAAGYTPIGTDCDDTDSEVYPHALEVCDGIDNDCDNEVDEDVTQIWFPDSDDDGFGAEEGSVYNCLSPEGYVSNDQDCNDLDPEIHPNAVEICDAVDNDCDTQVDDDDGNVVYGVDDEVFRDTDADGYGDADYPEEACEASTGYVKNSSDCNDDDGNVNPGEAEVCGDEIDNDCDGGDNDENGSDWYEDLDEDGYGDASSTPITSCTDPSDSGGCSDTDTSTTCYVAGDSTDCDDTDAAINSAATEVCDGADNDCNGDTDGSDASDASTWYIDTDTDGYGDSSASTLSCSEPSGYVENDDDCDDSDATISPDAQEVCDTDDVDEDCDGAADDADTDTDSSTQTTFYADTDSDGYGSSTVYGNYCDAPSGYVSTNGDCDDSDGAINPSASEVCDSVDNDCDGDIDDDDSDVDSSGFSTFYVDVDEDGYGDPTDTVDTCDVPSGYVADNTDCDDLDSDINPIATEVCDEVDNDCDGDIDDDDSSVDTSTMSDWYADSDGDGYGDSTTSLTQCAQPSGYVLDDTDCDDGDATIITGVWYADDDGDGYGDETDTLETCTQPTGYVADDTDCDDTDDNVNPEIKELYYDLSTATETDNCDTVDNDCDGDIDEGCTDDDGDGVDDGAQLLFACDADSDGVENSFCFPDSFTSPWAGEDCMYTLSPFTSITTAAAKTPVTVEFGGNTYENTCYINGGGSSGDLYVSAVSSIGTDGSTAVDTTDTGDWIFADFSWCDDYSSGYCYGSSSLPSGWGAQIYWDGTEVTVP